jgi:hypothetical protein
MSEAGFGRMVAQVLSYPAGLQHVLAKIRSSGDAIDWVIQRTGDVKLPQQSSDIGAIHAFFPGELIGWCTALEVCFSELLQLAACDFCIAQPVDHGLLLAVRDDALGERLILSFIPLDRRWDKERYALARLLCEKTNTPEAMGGWWKPIGRRQRVHGSLDSFATIRNPYALNSNAAFLRKNVRHAACSPIEPVRATPW